MKRIILLGLFLSLCTHSTVFGQQEEIYNLPPWLILEYGRKAYAEREYGVALRYAREALEKSGYFFPEAEILIGDVFMAEGNLDLAEQQYAKALNGAKQLYVLSDKYRILYKLAEIYNQTEKEKYKETLRRITGDDETYIRARDTAFGTRMLSILREEGLDKLIVLYRIKSDFSQEAHSMLGRLYFSTGEYEKSILHLVFTVLTVLSGCIEELQFYDPDYIFTKSEELFLRTRRYSVVQDYIIQTNLFENIFLLGKALIESGTSGELVRDMWEMADKFSSNARLKTVIAGELDLLQ